jgi:site-specific DNA-methyltransferase (adenine-specific)
MLRSIHWRGAYPAGIGLGAVDGGGGVMLALPEWSVSTLDTVHCLDALTLLCGLPSGSVDCVVTSPPYNLRNTVGGVLKKKTGKWSMGSLANGYATYDDNMPHEQYVKWQRSCLTQMMRVLKDTGAIFYNHKWRVQNGLLQDRQDIVQGFPVRQIIIWQRAGGHNFNPGYFVPTYEVIYLIAKSDFRLKPGANSYGDIWHIPQEANTKHPAPYPIALPEMCIRSTEADLILDPFIGSGTTAVAARNLGRHYIGCDISPEYVAIARKRLAQPFTLPMFETVAAK